MTRGSIVHPSGLIYTGIAIYIPVYLCGKLSLEDDSNICFIIPCIKVNLVSSAVFGQIPLRVNIGLVEDWHATLSLLYSSALSCRPRPGRCTTKLSVMPPSGWLEAKGSCNGFPGYGFSYFCIFLGQIIRVAGWKLPV